jgi:hypothetical protein
MFFFTMKVKKRTSLRKMISFIFYFQNVKKKDCITIENLYKFIKHVDKIKDPNVAMSLFLFYFPSENHK